MTAPFPAAPHAVRLHRWRLLLPAVLSAAMLLLVPGWLHATTVTPPTFADLVTEAQSIIRGRVTAVRSDWADSPQGRVIKTYVTFSVLKRLKGDAAAEITLQLLGGEIGPQGLRVEGMPRFEVGQEDFLFISGNGVRFCPLVAMMHGRYRVLSDPATTREYVARNDLIPLGSENDVELPQTGNPVEFRFKSAASALTPLAFEQSITAALDRRVSTP